MDIDIDYRTLRLIHIVCAHLSIAGFVMRGLLLPRHPAWRSHPLVRTLPHLVDTLLLASAIALATLSGQLPWQQAWLGTKVIALFVYIGLGFVAFRFGRTPRQRQGAWLAAIVVFGWMLSIARTREPLGFLSGLRQLVG